MMKKAMLLLLAGAIAFSAGIPAFAEDFTFPDLPESHWAYPYVSELVGGGTVNGNESGYFEPYKTVSRAEFVKMIGKGQAVRTTDFADVPKTHWGYDYIMSSGLKGDADNQFHPSAPMTRGDVIELIWTRVGKPNGIVAPSIITGQAKNRDAAAWIYISGVMIGSDGVDLRLGDTVSRAEAAALIVRARAVNENSRQIRFIDVVSPELLKTVFQSVNLFDAPYDPDRTLTNAEIARAAVRLASEEFNLTYRKFSAEAPFNHPDAKNLEIISKCIGQDKVNAAFVDKTAVNSDALEALTYGAVLKAHMPVGYGNTNNYYKDAPSMGKDLDNTILTFAYENGVQLYDGGRLLPDAAVTMKTVAAILLQLDNIIGLQSMITTDTDKSDNSIVYDRKLSAKLGTYPQTTAYFPCILEGLPVQVYTSPFAKMATLDGSYGKNPKTEYNFAREYSGMFVDLLKKYKEYIRKTYGINVRFTYIPSLLCDNQNGYTFRVKCEIVDLNGKAPDYTDVFSGSDTIPLYDGMVFYADAVTDYTMGTGVGGTFTVGGIVYKVTMQ